MLLADRGYDADWIRACASQHAARANIPTKRNRKEPTCFSPISTALVVSFERFFNKIKQCWRVAIATTTLQPTTPPSLSLHPSGYSCGLMSQSNNWNYERR